jgi:hypothetical protein
VIDKKYLQKLKRVNKIAKGNISRAKGRRTNIQENDLEQLRKVEKDQHQHRFQSSNGF